MVQSQRWLRETSNNLDILKNDLGPVFSFLKLDYMLFLLGIAILLFFWLTFVFYCYHFRPDTLDPALLRPGRLDRKVEFGLPNLESRTQIFKIHTRAMNCDRDIRFELLARLCPNSTGEARELLTTWYFSFSVVPLLKTNIPPVSTQTHCPISYSVLTLFGWPI